MNEIKFRLFQRIPERFTDHIISRMPLGTIVKITLLARRGVQDFDWIMIECEYDGETFYRDISFFHYCTRGGDKLVYEAIEDMECQINAYITTPAG